MPDERRHESEDLKDYQVLGASDTLDGAPGDDPLDRGVVTPDRWSAGIRFGTTAEELQAGESLDQQLAEEEPDVIADADDQQAGDAGADENATEEDVGRYSRAQGADPRAGRLTTEDEEAYDDGGVSLFARDDRVARDEGIDGGGAAAEEAAVHLLDDDTDS